MNISEMPYFTLRSSSRLSTCACTDTSSAETGSSQMMHLRIEDQRPGDARCAGLAARELVGPRGPRRLGVDADVLEHLADLGVALGRERRRLAAHA